MSKIKCERTLRRSFEIIVLSAALLLATARPFSQTALLTDDLTNETLRFSELYGVVDNNYVDPVDPDRAILEGGVRGMLATLDPFSAFFNQDQFEQLQQQARGEALGFGSILFVQPGKVVVLQTAEGSPSWRAGLGPGDEIVSINGTRLDRLDFNSLIEILQRSRSQQVRLGVMHPGKVVAQDFELKPAEVNLPTLDKSFVYAPGIAYAHLSGFESKTPKELVEAITRLGGPDLKGLLLDLRDNHGGMVDAAVATASLLLKPGLAVLSAKGRAMPEKDYKTAAMPSHFEFPVVMLVNGNTASAAEVFAAALEEHDRAIIAGEQTYGKGVVQSVTNLSEKTGLALTTARYFTPSGRSIQRPLPGTALSAIAAVTDPAGGTKLAAFHTDSGRPLKAGGGLTPDVAIPAPVLDPWVTFLNQRGTITSFASEYLTLHGRLDKSFEPDAKVMDEFRNYLGRQNLRVPEEYWDPDQAYLRLRIKTEVFNLQFGLSAGDEVETRGDPQVREASGLFSRIAALLKGE